MFRPSSLASRRSSEEGSDDWEGGGWIGNVRYACTRTRTRTTGRKVKPPSKYVAMKAIETPITLGATLCSAKVLSSLFTTFGRVQGVQSEYYAILCQCFSPVMLEKLWPQFEREYCVCELCLVIQKQFKGSWILDRMLS